MIDLSTLRMVDIIRLQNMLQQELTRRFERLREHEGATANDVVLVPTDPLQARQISRWHFELRRFADGYRLRSVSDGVTEVDGVPVSRGAEVLVRPGATIRVARVLTLVLMSPQRVVPEDSAVTRLV